MNFKSFLIITLFILSGCSDTLDNSDLNIKDEDYNAPQIEINTREDNPIGCDIAPGNTSFLVEFDNHISREERNAIREPMIEAGYLICAQTDVCHTNQYIELWVVQGNKNFKPLATTPNNPELKTAFATCPD